MRLGRLRDRELELDVERLERRRLGVTCWEVTTAGWHTPTLERLLADGWEPIGLEGGIWALRRPAS